MLERAGVNVARIKHDLTQSILCDHRKRGRGNAERLIRCLQHQSELKKIIIFRKPNSLAYLVRGEWDERDNTDPGHSWLSCFFHAFCCCSKPEYLHMMHFKRHMLLKHFVWIRQEVSPDVVWDLDKERGLETNPKPVQCSVSYACHADSHTSFCLIHYNCICIYTCDCILSVFVLSLHVMQTAASFLSIHCHCICICNCNCICIYICNCICIFICICIVSACHADSHQLLPHSLL